MTTHIIQRQLSCVYGSNDPHPKTQFKRLVGFYSGWRADTSRHAGVSQEYLGNQVAMAAAFNPIRRELITHSFFNYDKIMTKVWCMYFEWVSAYIKYEARLELINSLIGLILFKDTPPLNGHMVSHII